MSGKKKLTKAQRDVLEKMAAGEDIARSLGWQPHIAVGGNTVRFATFYALIDAGYVGTARRSKFGSLVAYHSITPAGRAALKGE